jgi:predicted transcriptional regulator of viral defense system
MKFLDFKTHFEAFKVFSVSDILKWDPHFDTRRLVEWQKKNYLKRIRNRWYLFADTPLDENFLYLTANRIYSPSYISFESAFAYYRLIPEGVYTITSATTLKTAQFNTSIGTFHYHRLHPRLMFGYRLVDMNNRRFKMVEPEKLLLDYLHINTTLQSVHDFESLRVNQAELATLIQEEKLMKYLRLFENNSLERRVTTLMATVYHA